LRLSVRILVPIVVVMLAGCSGGGSAGGNTAASPRTRPVPATLTPLVGEQTRTDTLGNVVEFAPVTLRRTGRLLLLEVAGRNVTPVGSGLSVANLPGFMIASSASFSDVSLVDSKHGKRYLVVRDSQGSCLCTDFVGGLGVPRGAVGVLDAYFAAPPADVTTVDVVVNKVGTFSAVPVS
jgi:hypothetical protein